ncbi:MAG: alpha/beta hydrolase [Microthrixaceae bacterium]
MTNGSIYLSMAHLTDGQQALWSARRTSAEPLPARRCSRSPLTATLAPSGSPGSNPDRRTCGPPQKRSAMQRARGLRPGSSATSTTAGDEERYTGAIETHPSPLGIIWGTEDPIAVIDMARRLHDRRRDSELVELEGVGHYPMIEAPTAFASSLLGLLADGRPSAPPARRAGP